MIEAQVLLNILAWKIYIERANIDIHQIRGWSESAEPYQLGTYSPSIKMRDKKLEKSEWLTDWLSHWLWNKSVPTALYGNSDTANEGDKDGLWPFIRASRFRADKERPSIQQSSLAEGSIIIQIELNLSIVTIRGMRLLPFFRVGTKGSCEERL